MPRLSATRATRQTRRIDVILRQWIEARVVARGPGALRVLRPVPGYVFAASSAGLALLLRHELDTVLPPGFPFLTFFPAIILTAFVAGLGPGMLCALLSGVGAWYFFLEPFETFQLQGPTLLALLFFAFIAIVEVLLIHSTQLYAAKLHGKRALTDRLYAEQKTMFEELQHRVANNMAFVASLLHLERRRVAAHPEDALAAIDEAGERIATMGRIHRRLYDPASIDQPIGTHLRAICDDLLKSTGARGITCTVSAAEMRIGLDRLVPLSLLVTELLTNCVKHAFAGRESGAIDVTLEAGAPGRLLLVVRDDGVGSSGETVAGKERGLGTRIVQGLASQLDGKLTIDRDSGTVARLDFAA